jgi:hypothetical protein
VNKLSSVETNQETCREVPPEINRQVILNTPAKEIETMFQKYGAENLYLRMQGVR